MAPMSLEDGSANERRNNTAAHEHPQSLLPEAAQTKPTQDLPYRPGVLDDYDARHPSPKTIPADHAGPSPVESASQRETTSSVRTPNTGEKIVESPAAVRPITKVIAHSILSNHSADRLDAKRPRKSLSWDLPDDRDNPTGQSQTKFIPASPLPEIVSQPPSSASDDTGRDVGPDRSFSPGRFRSSPAPLDEGEPNEVKPPPQQPWWQRGPFYNDFSTGKNYSRIGSLASTHRPSISTDTLPPRVPSLSSHLHWSDFRGRTSRRESTIGSRSRRSSYVPDVCHDPHCHFHRPHAHEVQPGCTCYTCQTRTCAMQFDDFSLFDRSTTSTSLNAADISAQPPRKRQSSHDAPSESTESSGPRHRHRWNMMQDDFMNLQDDLHDLQQDVDELGRHRSRLQHDVDHLLGERRHLEQLTEMDGILRRHAARVESMIQDQASGNEARSTPDNVSVQTGQADTHNVNDEESIQQKRDQPSGYVVFTEPFTRAQEYVFPISQCQTWSGLKSMILQSMRELGSSNSYSTKIDNDEFDLRDEGGRIVLPQAWKDLIRPELRITLVFWPNHGPTLSPVFAPTIDS